MRYMAAGVHQRLYKIVVFYAYQKTIDEFVQTDSYVVGDGLKRMFYDIPQCKVFSAHLLPYTKAILTQFGLK